MEDVTDVVFRHVVSEAGRPDVFFTEFTNSDSYCHPEGMKSVRGRLIFTEDEQPMVAHIWGDNPEYFRQMSIGMAELGFKGIDINMGCPVRTLHQEEKVVALFYVQTLQQNLSKQQKRADYLSA